MNMPITYFVYLAVSVVITVWVAHTLHSRGRVFLVDTFKGNETLADSVNDLLIVGFYLVNVGYVLLALKYGTKPTDFTQTIEFLATKIGLVMLILGLMHYFNLAVFSKLTNRHGKSHPPSPNNTREFLQEPDLLTNSLPGPQLCIPT